ncbi:MAG: TetR/AcrR family transcriptional regulator [Tabrizicola sp.]|nr:TetR/AcrR family transcriptional regulator [Tabrizicola sp.]
MSTEKTAEPVSARDRIVSTAGRLFYREGYRAVGVDRVIAEAEVAKATFYKHFPSKDDLIVAWISRAEEQSLRAVPPEDGPEPLTAYTDAMIAIAGRLECLGCTYQGSAAEFSDPGHPAHAAAIAVKQRVIFSLRRRAAYQGIVDPEAAADRIFLLLEGIWASVRMFGTDAPLGQAKEAIRRLVA